MNLQAIGIVAFLAIFAAASGLVMSDLDRASQVQTILVMNEFDQPVNVSLQGVIRGNGIQFASMGVTDGEGNVISPPAGYCSLDLLPSGSTESCVIHATFELDFDYVSGYDSTAYAKLFVDIDGPLDAEFECPASTTEILLSNDGVACEHAGGMWYP